MPWPEFLYELPPELGGGYWPSLKAMSMVRRERLRRLQAGEPWQDMTMARCAVFRHLSGPWYEAEGQPILAKFAWINRKWVLVEVQDDTPELRARILGLDKVENSGYNIALKGGQDVQVG